MSSNRPSLIRAIRGPVLLITLGVLFSMDHFGSYRFYVTWPVLLIVFGVLKLFERVGGSRAEAGPGTPIVGGPV